MSQRCLHRFTNEQFPLRDFAATGFRNRRRMRSVVVHTYYTRIRHKETLAACQAVGFHDGVLILPLELQDRRRSIRYRTMNSNIDTEDRPLVLIWELTQACDLACDHCRADAVPSRHPEELSTAEGKQLLEQVREFGEGQLVVFSGGDPLKRNDLVELVEYGTDIGLSVTLTPSGTRSLTRERLEALADAGLRRMALSFDGASAESHDAFRGEEGSFRETIEAARYARELGIPLQVNTTVCEATLDDLEPLSDLVAELGTVLWSVFFLVPVGRGAALNAVSPETADEIMEWLHTIQREQPYGIKTTEAPQYRRVGRQRRDQDPGVEGRHGIIAGDGFAFVSHTGHVFPSGFFPQSAGSVRESSVTEIYRASELFRSLRDRDNLEGKCGACPYRTICGGSRSRAFATTGNPLASDPLCPYVPPGFDESAVEETQG